ncbi:MAG TPA: AAA family ATPase [Coleofasciculaceae cyanobacterium]|jgi:chromosome partitioning protein
MASFEHSDDFQQAIMLLLAKAGWAVKMPSAQGANGSTPPKGYDLEAIRGNEVVAIQLKNYRVPIKVPQIEKFFEFLELPIAERFTKGFLITSSGYTHSALTYFQQANNDKVQLALYRDSKVIRITGHENGIEPPRRELSYLGVFTCKGGVGKTTISAHLAGAFALSGYDAALIDLDPQKNLTTLLGEGVKLPGLNNKLGNTVTVYGIDEWDDRHPPDVNVVVCDCSPVLEANPVDLIKKFSYCIIPTTLNPLGLNKNGHVIKRTIEAIRRVNQTAYLFILINNYFDDESNRSRVLKEEYQRYFAELSQEDERFKFIDPEEVAIRNSKQLFYWGYHIYSGDRYQLAFNPVGGRCLPKADFLNLLDYLEEHSNLEELKRH